MKLDLKTNNYMWNTCDFTENTCAHDLMIGGIIIDGIWNRHDGRNFAQLF